MSPQLSPPPISRVITGRGNLSAEGRIGPRGELYIPKEEGRNPPSPRGEKATRVTAKSVSLFIRLPNLNNSSTKVTAKVAPTSLFYISMYALQTDSWGQSLQVRESTKLLLDPRLPLEQTHADFFSSFLLAHSPRLR